MEQPILRIDHLTVRYGKTCDYCRNGGKLDKNTCPHCKCNLRRAAATGAFASGHSAEHNGHPY